MENPDLKDLSELVKIIVDTDSLFLQVETLREELEKEEMYVEYLDKLLQDIELHRHSTNERPASRSRDHSPPIRGQEDEEGLDLTVTSGDSNGDLSTNQSPASRSHDHSGPIRDKESDKANLRSSLHLDLETAREKQTNERPVSGSRDQPRPIRGQEPEKHSSFVTVISVKAEDEDGEEDQVQVIILFPV